ncbi:MAG: hypothetical protein GTO41_14900, partial [Burkholderiales bacterium]|nr:hypothetical protein [Burkholderiales bacterium]
MQQLQESQALALGEREEAENVRRLLERRKGLQQLYRRIKPTEEWVE